MNKLARYIILSAGIFIVGFLLWYFSSIVAYILISAVLSLIGRPLVELVTKVRFRAWAPPRGLAASITLLALWAIFILFFRLMIPLVVSQLNELSQVNVRSLVDSFREPIRDMDSIISLYLPDSVESISLQDAIISRVGSILNVGAVTNFFSSTASILGNLVVALFSISFITFFFLKNDGLFLEGLVIMFPKRIEENIKHALISINRLLRRYFLGIMLQSMGVMMLDTIGLLIIGIPLHTAVVIGLMRGVLNVIPYVGPVIGTILGILVGLATNLNLEFASQLLPLIIYMLIVFVTVQTIDNTVFQPLIFSSSVKAHPLEIFIVLLIAGSVGGIVGMLVAIPGYTVIRVFAKEFFNNFRVVQKLTENL